ncbi:MAG: ABC transporter permease [Lachnospiraceae bacterium]|nr:ABC transporter permease [Lachnospiraceae bacterium]
MISRLYEIYQYREMIYELVRRDLRGRYKGAALGFLWTFINPLMQLLVYTLVFSTFMRSDIQQYYIFLFVALVPWIFFSGSLTGGSTSILGQSSLVKKIYFPREVLPITFVTTCFVNMLLSFVVIFLVLAVSGYGFHPLALFFLPLVMIIEYMLALGLTILFCAVDVYFQDTAHILGIICMAWQFLTPVMYPSSLVPARFRTIWRLNPMEPIIETYRDILYYKQIPSIANLVPSAVLAVVALIVGELVFDHLQKGFATEL